MKNLLLVLFFAGAALALAGFVSGEERGSALRAPQFEQPKAGNTIDISFKVALDGVPAGVSCVSVMQEQATILISRDILEHLTMAKPADARTEEERMAYLNGIRAKILLDNLQDIKDGSGCSIVQESFDNDAQYLVSDLLKSGQAGVVDNAAGKPVDHIYIRYKAFVAAPLMGRGNIMFSFLEGSAPFLTVLWWIS